MTKNADRTYRRDFKDENNNLNFHQETVTEKSQFVMTQLQQAIKSKHCGHVTCFCGINAPIYMLFRCLYCGEFYCRGCAQVHFGKTIAEWKAENPAHQELMDAHIAVYNKEYNDDLEAIDADITRK